MKKRSLTIQIIFTFAVLVSISVFTPKFVQANTQINTQVDVRANTRANNHADFFTNLKSVNPADVYNTIFSSLSGTFNQIADTTSEVLTEVGKNIIQVQKLAGDTVGNTKQVLRVASSDAVNRVNRVSDASQSVVKKASEQVTAQSASVSSSLNAGLEKVYGFAIDKTASVLTPFFTKKGNNAGTSIVVQNLDTTSTSTSTTSPTLSATLKNSISKKISVPSVVQNQSLANLYTYPLIQNIIGRLNQLEINSKSGVVHQNIVQNIYNTYSSGGGSSYTIPADTTQSTNASIASALAPITNQVTQLFVLSSSNIFPSIESTSTATSTFVGPVTSDDSITASAFYGDGSHLTGITSFSTSTTRSVFSNTTTGLTYDDSSGITSLTSGYNIPLTASTTEWANLVANSSIVGAFTLVGSNNVYSASSTAPLSGANNFFFGQQSAGAGLSTGDGNSFVGLQSGYSNTSGYSNIGIGTATLINNTVGAHNIAMGYYAGRSISSGHSNILFGNQAGYSTDIGYENIMSGTSAGYSNTSGAYNIFLGYGAGDTNTTGTYNTIIGKNADVGSASLTNATAIGNGAIVDISNALVLGDGTANVGINNSSPAYKLDVGGTIHSTGDITSDSNITASSVIATAFYGDGSNLTGIATGSSFSTSTTRSVFSSSATGLDYDNSTGAFSLTSGYNIPLTASTTEWVNKVGSQWTTSGSDVYFNTGNVGVGITSPSQKLDVGGNILAGSGAGSAYVYLRDTYNYIYNADGLPVDIRGHHGVRAFNDLGEVARFGTASDSLNSYFNGNVGIGNMSPSYQLDITGDFNTSAGTIKTGGTTRITSSGGFYGSVGNASAPGFSFSADTNTGMYRPSADNLGLVTGGVERLLIDSSGDVAIGTSTPFAKFSIQQAFGSTTPLFSIASTTSSAFATSSVFTVLANGNVGVGTAAPSGKLHVAGTSNALIYYANGTLQAGAGGSSGFAFVNTAGGTWTLGRPDGSGGLNGNTEIIDWQSNGTNSALRGNVSFGTSFASRDTILSRLSANTLRLSSDGSTGSASLIVNGSIGIGTTTPGAKLHVVGTTEQLRLGYDASKYSSFTTGSTGGLTIASGGTGQNITLNPSTGGGIVLIGGDYKEIGSASNPSLVLDFGSDLTNAVTFLGVAGRSAVIGNTAGGVRVTSTYGYNFSLDTDTRNSADTGMYRNAAGAVEINNGTRGSWRDLIVRNLSFGTTSTSTTLTLQGGVGKDVVDFASSTGASLFRITQAGNVGIGTTDPDYKLTVVSAGVGFRQRSVSTSGWQGIDLLTNSGAPTQIYTNYGAGESEQSLILGTFTNRANQLVLKSTGNVGIATTTPGYALTVSATTSTGLLNITGGGLTNGNVITHNDTRLLKTSAFSVGTTYLGNSAGPSAVVGGTYNTGIGQQSMAGGPSSYNSALGYQSFYQATGGTGNTAVGALALGGGLSSGSPSYNTALGYNAGVGLTSGDYNMFIGYNAGANITSGSRNIVIGTNISAPVTTGSNQLNIGNIIYGTSIDGTGLTPSTGNISIGTSTPFAKFSIQQGFGSTTPLFSIASTTSSAFATSSVFTVLANGNVGIGTASPSAFKLQVAGNVGPETTQTYNLGSVSSEFSTFYGRSIVSGGNLTLTAGTGGGTIQLSANGINPVLTVASTGLTIGSNLGLTTTGSATIGDIAGSGRTININGQTTFTSGANTNVTTVAVKAKTSQTADLFQAQDSSGLSLFNITSAGKVGIGTTTPPYALSVVSSGNTQAWIGTSGASYGYAIGRNTSTGFLDILGNQGGFSGINVDKITSTGPITVGGNAVITNWASTLGLGSGSGVPNATLEIRGSPAVALAIGGGYGYNYNFVRNSATGIFEISGQQSGNTGYRFSTSNKTNAFTIEDGGKVGIGTSTPAFPLDVYTTVSSTQTYGYLNSSGAVGTAGPGASDYSIRAQGRILAQEFNAVSDARLKDVQFDLDSAIALDAINKLQPVSFTWKNNPTGQPVLGFLAQDVELAIPNAVSRIATGAFPDQRELSYNQIVAVAIGAIKEIKIQLDAVKEKITAIASWFGSDGDRFNVKGMVCVDDVCISKDQFKQMLINSGSVMVIPSAPVTGGDNGSNTDTGGNDTVNTDTGGDDANTNTGTNNSEGGTNTENNTDGSSEGGSSTDETSPEGDTVIDTVPPQEDTPPPVEEVAPPAPSSDDSSTPPTPTESTE